MAKTRTLVAEVDGVKYTKRTACNYRYFWVCDTVLPSGGVMKNAACGWSCKPVDKDGKHPSWSATWIYANTRCVPIASDQGETTVEKEKVEMTKQTQTKEEDAPVYVLSDVGTSTGFAPTSERTHTWTHAGTGISRPCCLRPSPRTT